jgi:hypothetical protein
MMKRSTSYANVMLVALLALMPLGRLRKRSIRTNPDLSLLAMRMAVFLTFQTRTITAKVQRSVLAIVGRIRIPKLAL